jgi:hypothetical protein
MKVKKLTTAMIIIFLLTVACVSRLHSTKDHAMHSYSTKWYGKGYFAGLIQFGAEGTHYTPIAIVVSREFDSFPWFEVYNVKKTKALDRLYTVYDHYGCKAIFVKFKGELSKEGEGIRGDEYSMGNAIIEEIVYFQVLNDNQYATLLKYKRNVTATDEKMPERVLREIGISTTGQ